MVPTSSPTPTAAGNLQPASQPTSAKKGLSPGGAAGVAITVIVVVLGAAGLFYIRQQRLGDPRRAPLLDPNNDDIQTQFSTL
jgi:uncharacterized protein HemX